MIKKRKAVFQVMADGKAKEESGYALIYALGAIILASLIVGAIFLFAMRTFAQIDRVDKLKQSKDVGEYALQKGSKEIKDKLEEELPKAIANTGIILDDDMSRFATLVNGWVPTFDLVKPNIGVDQRFSYKLVYDMTKLSAVKDKPYTLGNAVDGFGWTQETSFKPNDPKTNVKLTFPLTVVVKEKHDGVERTSTVTSNYVFEVQWEKVDANESIVNLDVWRNVFYSYYLPDSGPRLSTDEWLKKVNQLYTFQRNGTKPFDYSGYSNLNNPLYGEYQTQMVDITDGSSLDFTTGNKKMNHLRFAGSFLVEHGAKMKGNSGSKLETGNLLALRNQEGDTGVGAESYVQVDEVEATVGTYLDLRAPKSSLILDVADFKTSNLLINGTSRDKAKASTEGILFSKGKLSVGNLVGASSFSFDQYAVQADSQNPKTKDWQEFIDGSMVLAGSSLYAGPVSKSGLTSTVDDSREITVDGNFMMTNVGMKEVQETLDFAYFRDDQPTSPASLVLEGPNTKLTVTKGVSFIDSVKTSRRKSHSEYSNENEESKYPLYPKSFSNFYDDDEYWNRIILKDGAQMELGLTGVEPFHLEVAKKSYLSLKLLPENILFDDRFIEEADKTGHLKGKVILEPFSQADGASLMTELTKKGIKVTTAPSLAIATGNTIGEGQVVIVESSNTSSKEASRMISRTFDFVESIVY